MPRQTCVAHALCACSHWRHVLASSITHVNLRLGLRPDPPPTTYVASHPAAAEKAGEGGRGGAGDPSGAGAAIDEDEDGAAPHMPNAACRALLHGRMGCMGAWEDGEDDGTCEQWVRLIPLARALLPGVRSCRVTLGGELSSCEDGPTGRLLPNIAALSAWTELTSLRIHQVRPCALQPLPTMPHC